MDSIRGGLPRRAVPAVVVVVAAATLLGAAAIAQAQSEGSSQPRSAQVAAAYDPHLTRTPYLTDLVGLHVAINFATDTSGTSANIAYGAVDSGGGCTPATIVASERTSITVGTVVEYQWTSQVTLPAAGTYCYRAYLGTTDLLETNPSPQFTSQVPVGDTSPFSFDVMGDWGQVDATGANTDQANVLSQVATSGARFLVTVGDNGYPNGSQINYGDLQQTGANTSAIFGPQQWSVPGPSIPIFTAAGNHGLSGPTHTDITTWTQNTAVSTSGGRYQNDVYCCPNGSSSSNYGSEWYAFDAGNARFYVLDSAWGDTNPGTADPYANDALAHFAPGTPEYTWLQSDLRAHPTQLKFAFFHYPLYSDNNTQPTDTYLDGPDNLEGLLGTNGVQIVFNGHAHTYERNTPSAPGMPITYVTAGGGGTPEPIGTCHPYDAYGIGWSPTTLKGSACGAASPPTAAANFFEFLKVTVSGTSVTVAPTDSLGNTFDVQTYHFDGPATYLDATPPPAASSTDATFAFHASGSPATFSCQLDSGAATPCTSPRDLTGLAEGQHTFQVTATVGGETDPTPAAYSWLVDATPPGAPPGLTATANGPFEADLTWSPATDNTGVTGYRIYRDGALAQAVGPVTSVNDPVLGNSTHTYTVTAVDAAGNESTPSPSATVITQPPPAPVFADGFESGDLSSWTASAGLTVETTTVRTGIDAAEGNTAAGNTYAKKTLPATYADGFARVAFDVPSQAAQVNLLRLRDSTGLSLGYAYLAANGTLGFHNDATGTNTASMLTPGPGWHALELRIAEDASPATATGAVQVWLDNLLVPDLSNTAVDVGSAPIGALQIGETQTGRTYDVVFDDAAFGTSRLGPVVSDVTPVAPDAPTDVRATAGQDGTATVTFTAPAYDGGAPISGYAITPSSSCALNCSGLVTPSGTLPATSMTVGGLTNGVAYTFAVTAVNGVGTSVLSTSSPAVTPTTSPTAAVTHSTTDSSTPVTSSSGGTSATASGGTGSVTVGQYADDPTASLPQGAAYMDVSTATGSTFTQVVVADCGLNGGQTLSWWNPAVNAWQPVTPAAAYTAGPPTCLTVTLNSASSPLVSQLGGTIFGAFGQAASPPPVNPPPVNPPPANPPSSQPTSLGAYTATGPTRILDTRVGTGAPNAPVGPKSVITLTIPNLPAGTTAAVLNLAATHLTGSPNTYVSACPTAQPLADCTATAVLNAVPRVDTSNEITVPVGPDGTINLYNNAGSIDLVADLVGYQTGELGVS